jgi:hypothetical protein
MEFRNLKFDSPVNRRRSGADSGGYFINVFNNAPSVTNSGLVVDNCWFNNGSVAIWQRGNGLGINAPNIKNSRIRNCYADGIHLHDGASGNSVSNCHIRGTGDDGFAITSIISSAGAANNKLSNCLIEGQWFGRGVGIFGGANTQLIDNTVITGATRFTMLIGNNFSGNYMKNTAVTANGNTFNHHGSSNIAEAVCFLKAELLNRTSSTSATQIDVAFTANTTKRTNNSFTWGVYTVNDTGSPGKIDGTITGTFVPAAGRTIRTTNTSLNTP